MDWLGHLQVLRRDSTFLVPDVATCSRTLWYTSALVPYELLKSERKLLSRNSGITTGLEHRETCTHCKRANSICCTTFWAMPGTMHVLPNVANIMQFMALLCWIVPFKS